MSKIPLLPFRGIFLALTIFLISPVSFADMVLDNVIIHFEKDSPNRRDVTVSNGGSDPLYIEVIPYKVNMPGTPMESRNKVTNPKKAGLLVSPNKLVVKPGTRKVVRFVNLNTQRDEEGVYRVLFKPVTGPIQAEETGVKLMIGYEVLVLAHPKNTRTDLQEKRQGNSLELTNSGNVDVYLRQGMQCQSLETPDSECHPLPDKRLYPGNSMNISLANNGPVKYQLGVGSQNTVKIFNQ